MKKLRIIPIILLLSTMFALFAGSAFAVDPPNLKSTDECLLVDISTGKPLFSIIPDQNHSIASLTKIMTVLIAVEQVESGKIDPNEMVTASSHVRYGLDTSSSNADITEGEEMSYENLMYCALVHSANDACNVLAEYIAGDIQSFIRMMNERAKELGCTNTQFNDTCGMLNRSDGHYSCANDLYLITMEAMKHSLFYKICSTVDYTVPATNKHAEREIHNSNALMSENGLYGSGYLYEGVVGVKTGFTKPAGYCLVSTCEKNGLHLFCVVMGCNGPLTYTVVPGEYQNFLDSAALYDWAFSNFAYKTIFLSGERLKRLPVKNAKEDATVAIAPDENLKLLLAKDVSDNSIHIEVNVDQESLVAPIKEGDILGTVDVYISDEKYATCNAVAATSVELEKKEEIKQNISNFFSSKGFKIAVAVILGLIIVAVVGLYLLKARRIKILKSRIKAQEKKRAKLKGKSENRQTRYRDENVRYDDSRPPRYERCQEDSSSPQYEDDYEDDEYSEDDFMSYEEYKSRKASPQQNTGRKKNTSSYQPPDDYETSENVERKSESSSAEDKRKWEEANLDDVLRSLGFDPDNLK